MFGCWGNGTVKDFDPILMLDSFDSLNPADYRRISHAPHRGIETISYVVAGRWPTRTVWAAKTPYPTKVQWMTAGSGIMHDEMIPPRPDFWACSCG